MSQWLGIVKFLTRNGFTPIDIIGIVLAVGLVIALIILAKGKTNQ